MRKRGALLVLALSAFGLGAATPRVDAVSPCGSTGAVNGASCTYSTPAYDSFTVPSGVTSIDVVATGAQGGSSETNPSRPGGLGGRVTTTVPVQPGQTLYVTLGGQGGTPDPGSGGGGYGGTGYPDLPEDGGGGGGPTVLAVGSWNLNPLVVAGGGGGRGGYTQSDSVGIPGAGGGLTGGAGTNGSSADAGVPGGGGGGTQSQGGTGGGAGVTGTFDTPGLNGGLLQGGSGGGGYNAGGGGGGGGYFGGGGGGSGWQGAGGGGGSSFATETAVAVNHEQGVRSGDGQLVITWDEPDPPQAAVITRTEPDIAGTDATPVVHGTSEPQIDVYVFSNGDCSGDPIGLADRDTEGNWSLEITDPLSEGTATFSALSWSEGTGLSADCSAPRTYTYDITPPSQPDITDYDPDAPANDNFPEVKGTAEAGTTVFLSSGEDGTGGCYDDTPAGSGSAEEFADPGITVEVSDNTNLGHYVWAVDAAGNVSPCDFDSEPSYTEDSEAPEASIENGPSDGGRSGPDVTFSLAGGAADVDHLNCTLDGDPMQCIEGGNAYEGLTDGSHTFSVVAVDTAGNTGPSDSVTWNVDATGPTVSITSGPQNGGSGGTSVTFEFSSSASDAARFECKLDDAPFATCSSGQTYDALAGGTTYTFAVRAIDDVGNIGPSSTRMFTVDAQGPVVTITVPKTTTKRRPKIKFTADESPVTFYCQLDGGTVDECTSPFQPASNLKYGKHVIVVYAVDDVGNTGPSATKNFKVVRP